MARLTLNLSLLSAPMNSQPTLPTESPAAAVRPGLAAAFERHLAAHRDKPAWWLDLKRKAFAEFERLPMPTRKSEQWRFASIGTLALDDFAFGPRPAPPEAGALAAEATLVASRAGRMVFADEALISLERVSSELEQRGVVWEPLSEALLRHRELLEEYFMAQAPHLGSEKFAALHTAFVESGCLLYVPAGVEIALPFVARHWVAADRATAFPHTLVIAGDNARVTLVDVFGSRRRGQQAFACGFNHLFAGAGARIDYYALQNWSDRTTGFQINSLVTARDAAITSLAVNMGCSRYRSETQSILEGEASHVEMLSLSLTDHGQEIDQRTLQSHLAPGAKSNLLFKNALMDDSRTIFSGMIRVAEDAQKTDAYQSNRNLLLSDNAEANALPGLEIGANDVRCTHGATTSQVDENELFYMLSRGIRPGAARELAVFGFFEEVISRIENDELAARVRELIVAKFREDAARLR
jgi:Fe-S cluster assembly protein SufD